MNDTEPRKIQLKNLPQVVNKSFYTLFDNRDRWLLLMGGAGSGKSYFAVEKILVRILKAAADDRRHRFLCLRKTQPAARKSVFALFKEYIESWGLTSVTKINKTDMTITIFDSEIIITGIDDKEKIKSVHGITGIWLEEATEFTYKEFIQLDLRLRGILKDYKQIILSFNPIDELHWIRTKLFTDELQAEIEGGKQFVRREYEAIIDGQKVTYAMTIMHSTYKDNQFIDLMYKARLETMLEQDLNYHKIYTLGQWGILEGIIFDNWEVTKEWPESPDEGGFGLDFGFSADEAAVIEVAFDGRDLYARECLYELNLTNNDISDKLKPITKDAPHSMIVADSAEPKSIVEIRQKGHFILPCVKGPDSVNHGIQRIKQYRLMVDYNSPKLQKELGAYKWAENKDGTLKRPPKPVDYNNHLIDALRYVVTKIKGMQGVSLDIIDREEETKTYFDEAGFKTHDKPTETQDVDNPALWNEVDNDDL